MADPGRLSIGAAGIVVAAGLTDHMDMMGKYLYVVHRHD
jgi:hypothetical protein